MADTDETSTAYFADHDLAEVNILETVIEYNDEDLEVIVIDIMVHFPFPEVGGIDVVAHNGMEDVDLISSNHSNNLEHYSAHAVGLTEGDL